MKYKGTINDPKDLVTKEYVDTSISNAAALKPMKSAWTGNIPTSTAASLILADPDTQAGSAFLGGVTWTDLPFDGNGEVKAFVVLKSGSYGIVQFELSSSNVSPYAWFFNSVANQWRSYIPVVDNLTSTAEKEALSAKQGKVLNDSKEPKGKITVNGTEYTVAISTTDAGVAGQITFVVEA